MARKTKPADPRAAIVETALRLAAEGRWRGLSLDDLAKEAALPVSEVYALFETPAHVAAAILASAVAASMNAPPPETSLSPKDRLFDAAMNVLDALKDRRAALGAMLAAYRFRPLAGAPVLGALARFARVALERAGIGAGGAAGAARIAALARSLWLVLQVFGGDDEGLSRTMAALDTRLREAEGWAKRFGWGAKPESARSP